MIGGLAMFLYGMSVMGGGLEKMSGGKLERILESLTSNPFKAVLLGAGVTAVIQSSSATTVMVVGFVNSGIMKLSQAIGIIMGANIGTTVTSWLLSLTGIESSNFLISMLKPSSFSPVLALIGIIMYMSGKDKKKDIGEILLGFAILMFGMETMSDAVKPLADVPEVYGYSDDVQQSGIRRVSRSAAHRSHSEFFGFCWYPAGIVCHRSIYLRFGYSDYLRTKYRNLCHSDDLSDRCKPGRKENRIRAFIFQHYRNLIIPYSILY